MKFSYAKSKTVIGLIAGSVVTLLFVNGVIEDATAQMLYAGAALIFGVGVSHKIDKRTDAIAKGK